MATRDDAAQGARVVISAVIYSVADGALEIGAATPVVAPLCVALLKAKEVVDGASRNKEELAELHEWCKIITEKVIDKAEASNTSTIDVSPLRKCVDKLAEVAKRYHDQGRFAKLVHFRTNGDDIQRLRARIRDIVPIMTLVVGVDLLTLLHPGTKLAPVPKKAPVTKSLHVVRDGVVDRACKILVGDGGPAMAALTGRSGAGKTTAAASMVGERGDRVRALFPDGVVWLRVGNGAGAADRLSPLMLKLAKRLREDVMKGGVDAPEVGEDGESYMRKIVSQEKLRCLVVADDVWDPSVVQKLRETGMWVLVTTRFPEMVQPNERVVMDTLTEAEAEDVLRGAAELPPGERLCDAVNHVLKICGRVAMDTAFVGSWICHVETKRKGDAWARAVEKIKAQSGGVGVERNVNRLAILRAGFEYLGTENVLAQKLYAELAVFPDGHAFGKSDAAVLLGDGEVATKPMSILERWGVLRADASDKYRMHDAHVDFARDKLTRWEDVREPVVGRWTSYISRLVFAINTDVYALLNIWRALEKVGGEGWWVSRPYDDQLVSMDASDPWKIVSLHVVAELYDHDRKFRELDAVMKKVLEQSRNYPEVQMAALFYSRISLSWQGRFQESRNVARRLGELFTPGLQLQLNTDTTGFLHMSTTYSMYGSCAKVARRWKDAEEWFRKALKAQEGGGLTGSYEMRNALFGLGHCAREAGRLDEAEQLFQRALKITEAKLGPNDLQVAWALRQLGLCVRQARRPGEAEELLRRAMGIKEAKLGADDLRVASTRQEIRRCVRQAGGRQGEAEELFKQALKIKEAKWGSDDLQVTWTLRQLSLCVREAGRPEEAGKLLTRELNIKKAKLKADDPKVAWTLHEMGLCVREAGRPREAEELFKQALKIKQDKLGLDDFRVGVTMQEMGVCVMEAGRPGEAEELLKRALKIREAKVEASDPQATWTLHEMGLCAREVQRPRRAEELLKRQLSKKEAELEADDLPDDLQVAWTLCQLGLCVRKAGRSGEAAELFKRALGIKVTKWGPDHLQVAWTLRQLGLCVREAGRSREAEALFKRALKIKEAKSGADDPRVLVTLDEMGVCVDEAGAAGRGGSVI